MCSEKYHTYTMEYDLTVKKMWYRKICRHVDGSRKGKRKILSDLHKIQKNKYNVYSAKGHVGGMTNGFKSHGMQPKDSIASWVIPMHCIVPRTVCLMDFMLLQSSALLAAVTSLLI